MAGGVPFRAVVADSFYGEDEEFRQALSEELGVGYVMALKPSHSWWHKEGEIGALWEAALAAGWEECRLCGAVEQGDTRLSRWARGRVVGSGSGGGTLLVGEIAQGVRGHNRPREVAPSWHVVSDLTNLPAPGEPSERAKSSEEPLLFAPASLAEVVRLYGLRMWVEQSYKQVKHALGWSDYQVRSDRAIRRHWQLVLCAFSFCWWNCDAAGGAEGLELVGAPSEIIVQEDTKTVPTASSSSITEERGEKERAYYSPADMAASTEASKGMARAIHNGVAILASVQRQGPTRRVESIA